nr:hypothetical protein [Tanacetum cinerariifolium]
MSARGRDHRRQQPRNTAARTSGHAARDPRDVEIEKLYERIRELEINPFNRYERQFENTPIRSDADETEEDDFKNYFHDSPPQTPPQHHRQPPAPHHPTDPLRSLGIRTKIPEFDGKLNPDDFLDWLQIVERIFDLRDIPDNVKVKLVAIKLTKYASLWWEHIQQQRYRNGKHKISSWDKMQRLLRAKFLPLTFKQDAYLDYQNLRQGSLSVEDLITEFEWMHLRYGAEEDEEQVIARFLGVLRPDIADAVSLTQYYSFSDLMFSLEAIENEEVNIFLKCFFRFELKYFDPFLVLDEFSLCAPAGFPDHPHRGFETVTYMLQGAVTHEDFEGRKGTIGVGDLQWMTAGRGIVHSEMPASNGTQKGLQLWINLSSTHKMIEPRYQELDNSNIAEATEDGVTVRVIAGESLGISSPIYTRTPTMFLDFTLEPDAQLQQPIPESWNAFVYVLEGEGVFGKSKSSPTSAHNLLLLGPGNGLNAWNKSSKMLRFILVGGEPLEEPVVQWGPFVMNTQEEIDQTIQDYENFENGFEKARYWRSEATQQDHDY